MKRIKRVAFLGLLSIVLIANVTAKSHTDYEFDRLALINVNQNYSVPLVKQEDIKQERENFLRLNHFEQDFSFVSNPIIQKEDIKNEKKEERILSFLKFTKVIVEQILFFLFN